MSHRGTSRIQERVRVSSPLWRAGVIALLGGLLLGQGACSSGGGEGASSTPSGTPGVATGTITGFGSIFVGGTEFFIDDNTRINSGSGREDDLRVGFVVTVEAVYDDGGATANATSIEYDEALEGPVTAVNAGQVEVAGQLALLDDSTVFDDVRPENLALGQMLEIHGFLDADGRVRATRVELTGASFQPGIDEIEIEGQTSEVTATTFRLGNLIVDYSGAELRDTPPGGLADGLRVEVKSETVPQDDGGQLVLTARSVEVVFGLPSSMQTGQHAEVEGYVVSLSGGGGDPLEVVINGQRVRIGSSVVYENGGRDDLRVDVKVEVEGRILEDGVILAENVSIRKPSDVRIEADVEEVTASGVTLLGIPVAFTTLTQMEDQSDERLVAFSLSDIRVGDRLEVRAYLDDGGRAVANRIERRDPEDDGRVSLQGPAEVETVERLSILEVTVLLGSGTDFEDQQDQPISRDQFFDALSSGSHVVKAQGSLTPAGEIDAREVELEG